MVDIKKLHSIFVDEAMERITELEKGLLQLEKTPHDTELLNSIFRAAHTIKGSSGSLGLNDISAFTHNMEEILDAVRKGSLIAEKQLINVLLDAIDMIKEMVEAVAENRPFEFGRCENLINRMKEIKNRQCVIGNEQKNKEDRIKTFKIIFIPSADIFRRGIDPLIIIDDLKNIGKIMGINCQIDSVPTLSNLNPEDLYLRWVILLMTDRNENEIREIFEFVEEGSEIRITPANTHEYENYMSPLGKMLVDEGIVREEDVKDALNNQQKLGEILIQQGKVSQECVEKMLERQSSMKIQSFKNVVSSTIRVDLKKLDHLINIVGEMVIIHSMFQQAIQGNGGSTSPERLCILLSQLQRIGSDIQESAMSLRMLPVGEVFQRFTRLVRELSESKNKKVELIITGEDTELDKGVLEKITDPLVHLIRNAIDHGIELPEERLAKGKPEKGIINLSAYQIGDSVYIDIEDDGRGLNKEKIVEKAISKKIINSTNGLTDEQIYNLIFLPGFSTAESVTDVSGRGVGMDVVKKNIESLNGKVYIHTRQDKGTTVSIKLPLTLAIIDGLTILIGEEVFVVPITSVVESFRPKKTDIKTIKEKGEVVNVRGQYIPLLRLHDILGITPWNKDPWNSIVIVTTYEGENYCLLADDIIGQQQIVIKNLGKAMPKLQDIAGGTILGDGRVALVLDVPGIVEMAHRY